jgi:hypothetical protein
VTQLKNDQAPAKQEGVTMTHLDTSSKAREIAPLCGRHGADDSLIFVNLENQRDLKTCSEYADCLKCKSLALETSERQASQDRG